MECYYKSITIVIIFEEGSSMRFDGSDYKPEIDNDRLTAQHLRIKGLMLDGNWRTLEEIKDETKDPTASISAQLRHLRKPRYGSYVLEKRSKEDRSKGLFEYRVLPPNGEPQLKQGLMEQFVRRRGLWEDFISFKDNA